MDLKREIRRLARDLDTLERHLVRDCSFSPLPGRKLQPSERLGEILMRVRSAFRTRNGLALRAPLAD